MKTYVIAVGGTGAKVVQAMIHLAAAGLLPKAAKEVDVILVDPDENNGSTSDCQRAGKEYLAASGKEVSHDPGAAGGQTPLQLGETPLFDFHLKLTGPWSPVENPHGDTLKDIFHYTQLVQADSPDADLLDLLFEPAELDLPVKQGFRGRPAIGATILARAIDFEDGAIWNDLAESVKNDAAQGACVLLIGSVFGGSGAAGAPTIIRLVAEKMKGLANVRMGLLLMLPYFQFQTVPNEPIQADPAAFPMATAEALKYYDERQFLGFCQTIFAVGEAIPAEMTIPAVGAAAQRNEPHFTELIGALGAFRFFLGEDIEPNTLAVAARQSDGTLTWADLPCHELEHRSIVQRLEQMIVFAVAYKYIFYPLIKRCLANRKSNTETFWVNNIEKRKIPTDVAGKALKRVHDYLEKFLEWLLDVSTPRRAGFTPGLVNPNVFATMNGAEWRLRTESEFNEATFGKLLVNRTSATRFDARSVYNRANRIRIDHDPGADGPGRLIRVLYEACEIE